MKTVYVAKDKADYECPHCGDLKESSSFSANPVNGDYYERKCYKCGGIYKVVLQGKKPEFTLCECKNYPGAWVAVDKNLNCTKCGKAVNSASSSRGSILQEALDTINGERLDSYGEPEDSFSLIAEYWGVYITEKVTDLDKKGRGPGGIIMLSSKDVAIMMTLLKLARESHQHKRDNLKDAAGYLGIAGDLSE